MTRITSRERARALDPLRNFLRDHGVTGLLLHHANQQGDTRGSTGIAASVENIVRLKRVTGGAIEVMQMPSRFGEVLPAAGITYRMVDRGDRYCRLTLYRMIGQ